MVNFDWNHNLEVLAKVYVGKLVRILQGSFKRYEGVKLEILNSTHILWNIFIVPMQEFIFLWYLFDLQMTLGNTLGEWEVLMLREFELSIFCNHSRLVNSSRSKVINFVININQIYPWCLSFMTTFHFAEHCFTHKKSFSRFSAGMPLFYFPRLFEDHGNIIEWLKSY